MARIKTNIGVIHGSGPARNLRIRLFFRRFTGEATAAVFIIVLFFDSNLAAKEKAGSITDPAYPFDHS
jgi:hypothetical protein